MISALMNQKYKNGRPLTEREVAHIMIALLMAGQHTSSTSGTWTMLHIADNPDVAYVFPYHDHFRGDYLTSILLAMLSTESRSNTSVPAKRASSVQ